MIRAGKGSLSALVLLVGLGACDGGEIVVFSAVHAGSAGANASGAGSGGNALMAGASFGGSLDAAGSSGAATSGSGGGGGDTVDAPCQNSDDCEPTRFCQKQDCSSTSGVCLPKPVSDDPVRAPVCGCEDHRTYFNDTLRQQYRVSASTPSECGSVATTCSTNEGCGTDGSCSIRLNQISECGAPGLGQCWVVPNDCSTTIDKPHFTECPAAGAPPGGAPMPCLTTCQAVQLGLPYLPAPRNACQ